MSANSLFPATRSRKNDIDVFDELRSEMNRMFNRFSLAPNRAGASADMDLAMMGDFAIKPDIDVSETDTALLLTVDVPGVKEEDIEVELDGSLLSIKGKRETGIDNDSKGYRIIERSSGSFRRALRLPFVPQPDNVAATLDSGVLKLNIEEPPSESTGTKRIKISGDSAEQPSG